MQQHSDSNRSAFKPSDIIILAVHLK